MSTIDVNPRSVSIVYPKHFYVYCAGYYDTYHSLRDPQTTCSIYPTSVYFQLEIFTQCMPTDDMFIDEDYSGF